jgi:hypothetical protein
LPIKTKLSRILLSLLIAAVIATSILNDADGARDGFAVQNVEISPKVARNGENVRVKANLRNLENKTKSCCVTAFVENSVVEEIEEITFSPRETISLLFTVNTTSLQQGSHSVKLVVEQSMNNQDILDLGTIVVQQEISRQESNIGFNMLYLLPVLPVGVVGSFFLWKWIRNKRKGEKLPENLLPNLLNEVLNFEGNMEKEAGKNKNPSDDKSYIR